MRLLVLCGMIVVLALSGSAATVSYQGDFTQDDDIQLIQFSVSVKSMVEIYTLSYGGGINAQGEIVPAGGFAPVLSLFTLNPERLLRQQDQGSSEHCAFCAIDTSAEDPDRWARWDAYFTVGLEPGSYLLAITEDDNTARGPSFWEGFERQGQGNFTGPVFLLDGWQTDASFVDPNHNGRTSHWEVELNLEPVPEPGALWLCGIGMFLTALCQVYRKCTRPATVTTHRRNQACSSSGRTSSAS